MWPVREERHNQTSCPGVDWAVDAPRLCLIDQKGWTPLNPEAIPVHEQRYSSSRTSQAARNRRGSLSSPLPLAYSLSRIRVLVRERRLAMARASFSRVQVAHTHRIGQVPLEIPIRWVTIPGAERASVTTLFSRGGCALPSLSESLAYPSCLYCSTICESVVRFRDMNVDMMRGFACASVNTALNSASSWTGPLQRCYHTCVVLEGVRLPLKPQGEPIAYDFHICPGAVSHRAWSTCDWLRLLPGAVAFTDTMMLIQHATAACKRHCGILHKDPDHSYNSKWYQSPQAKSQRERELVEVACVWL